MKVTVCQLASQYIHSSLAPWYLKAAVGQLCRHPHDVTIAEGTVNESPAALAARLCQTQPDLIGLSCYIWNIAMVETLLPLLKAALPHTRILLGGPEVSFCAEEVLCRCPLADFILCGEGEISLSALLDALEENASLETVPGLCRRSAAGFLQSPPPAPLTCLFDPYTKEYFSALNGRICYVETTRGCPFSCAYCLSGREDRLRKFDLQQSFDALLRLAASGTKTIKFVDRTFNADEERAIAIWQFLKLARQDGRIPAGVCFHFEVAADLFTSRSLSFLGAVPAGLFQFEAGLQSFYEPTLAAVQRKTDSDRLVANLLSILAGGNIHLHIDLIAGLPHESFAEFGRSFDRAFAIGAHQLQLGFLKLIYGSGLRQSADRYGMAFSHRAPYQILHTDCMSEQELLRLAEIETALGRLSNSGRFARSLPYLLSVWQGGAFSFFSAFAAVSADLGQTPHADQTAQRFFAFGSAIAGVNRARLRDLLAMDTLASRRLGRLPDFLKVPDQRLKAVNLRLKNRTAPFVGIVELCRKFSAGQIAFCILYSSAGCCGAGDSLALFDYTVKDPVAGQYAMTLAPLEEFLAVSLG